MKEGLFFINAGVGISVSALSQDNFFTAEEAGM